MWTSFTVSAGLGILLGVILTLRAISENHVGYRILGAGLIGTGLGWITLALMGVVPIWGG
jgi:hypothetical protein